MADDIIAANAGHGPQPWLPDTLDYPLIQLAYDAGEDTLFVTFGSARAGTTVDNPNGVWWRIDSETGEIYGVEIPGFERYFLKHGTHDEQTAELWHLLKGQKTQNDESRGCFLQRILSLAGPVAGRGTPISSTDSQR